MEIGLIHTEELIDELLDRFDHIVFMGIQELQKGDGAIKEICKWKGNSYTCAGLGQEITRQVLDEYESRKELA